jgi:hypothetical protein
MPHRLARLAALLLISVPLLSIHGVAAAQTAAMWHLDERVGKVAHDSSSHRNDGTTHNVRLAVRSPNGRAIRFNGRNSRILVDSSRSLNPGTDDFAVIAMVRFTTPPPLGEDYDLVRKGLSSTDGGSYKMEIIHVGGVARAYCGAIDAGGDKVQIMSERSYADGRWHTIRCELDGSTWSVTVDGVIRSTSAESIGSISNSGKLAIGAKLGKDGGDWYLGRLDEVRIAKH